MSTTSTVQSDLNKVESTVKTDINSAQSTIKTDLAKTYPGKVVALAFAAGLVVGPILLAIGKAIL